MTRISQVGSIQDVSVGSTGSLYHRFLLGGVEFGPSANPFYQILSPAATEVIPFTDAGIAVDRSLISLTRIWDQATFPPSWSPYVWKLTVLSLGGTTLREVRFYVPPRDFAHQLLTSDLAQLHSKAASLVGGNTLSDFIEEAWLELKSLIHEKTLLHPAQILEPERFRPVHVDLTLSKIYAWASQGQAQPGAPLDLYGSLSGMRRQTAEDRLSEILQSVSAEGADSTVSRDRTRQPFFY
jgi:hypothetical protein